MNGSGGPALRVEDLWAWRGRVQVLRGVTLEVAEGETVAVVGPNGVGKSTLVGSLVGLVPARSGRVVVAGEEVTGLPPERMAQLGVALVPERRQLFGPLSVRENLALGAYRRYRRERGRLRADLEEVLGLFPALVRHLSRPAANLSGGEQQMVAIGRALMARPRILLLDEPSLGLAPRVRAEIFRALRRLADRGTTILLVEQNLRATARVCHRAYRMERGRIVGSCRPEDLAQLDGGLGTGAAVSV